MASQNEHILWADKLADYAAGRLSAADMHAMEEAAHADPFLMDALEGYVILAQHNKLSDIDKVLAALPAREKALASTKVIPLFGRRWVQWAAAASVVLLVGIGLFTQRNADEVPQIASAETQADPSTANINPSSIEAGDSITIGKEKSADVPQAIVRNADNLPRSSRPEKANTEDPAKATAPVTLMDEGRARAMQSAEALPILFNVNGKVVDEANSEPIDNAVIALGGKEVISDPIGRFTIGAAALPAELKVGAVGYRTKIITWQEGDNFLQVPLQKAPATTEEKIVAGLSSRKADPALVVIPNDTSTTAPLGGWPAFNTYFKQNMQAKGTSKIYKSVTLSFAIDAAGKPVDIEVGQSPGKEAEAEAIRLLQNGPRWRRGRGEAPMATITVKY